MAFSCAFLMVGPGYGLPTALSNVVERQMKEVLGVGL